MYLQYLKGFWQNAVYMVIAISFNILVIKAKAIIGKLFLKNLKVKYIEWTTHHINNLHVKS